MKDGRRNGTYERGHVSRRSILWIAGASAAAGIARSGRAEAAGEFVETASYDANTILKADDDNAPVALAVPPSSFVGRGPTGAIAALTVDEAAELLAPATGGDSVIAVATREQLTALVPPPARATVQEVEADYRYDATSTAPADGWAVLSATAGGRFLLDDDSLTLPITGGGADDWPNFAAANRACAAVGVTLRLGPGTYQAKSRQVMASGLHLVCTPDTNVACDIPSVDNRDTPFTGFGTGPSVVTAVAIDTRIGDTTVILEDDLDFQVGEFIEFFQTRPALPSFRGALYQVIAYSAGTRTVTLDRPLRISCVSPIAGGSFQAGAFVGKMNPARDILLDFRGARVYGPCNRYIEFITSWNCSAIGPVHLGDGSTATAVERLASIDEISFNCHATRLIGDGGGVTTLGYTFESAEACSFSDSVVRGCTNAGVFFQDGVDCVARDCVARSNRGIGAVFGAAQGTVLGSDGCRIVGGSYSGNIIQGIQFERGSSRCTVDGASVIGNRGAGIMFISGPWTLSDNLIRNVTTRFNAASGIDIQSSSVRTRVVETGSTDNLNGVLVGAGTQDTSLSGVDVSRNGAGLVLSADTVLADVTCIPKPASANWMLTVGPDATVRARGLRFEGTHTTSVVMVFGKLDIDQSTITTIPQGIGVTARAGAVARIGSQVRIGGQATTGIGVHVNGGTAQIGPGADIQGRATYISGNGALNFGKATVGVGGTVTVAYAALTPSDVVMLTQSLGSGAIRVAQSPGVGFTITGTAGDVFLWKVV